jgi:hypothetical protein
LTRWSLRVRRLQLGNQEKKEKETLADSDYNIENKADVGSQGLFVSFFSQASQVGTNLLGTWVSNMGNLKV